MKYLSKSLFVFFISLTFIISSCSDDDSPLATLGVAFETTALGLSDDVESVDVVVSLSRATTVDSEATITFTESGVAFGTDYTTNPVASGGTLTISIPAGEQVASFRVTRIASALETGSTVVFTLTEVTGEENAQISGNTSLTVSFEAIVSAGADFTANIGGPTEPNQVFVDFSLNTQTTAERTSWDLGFYSGSDDKVILNYSTYVMAQALDKTDMNDVTAADTVGFAGTQAIGTAGAHVFIDHPDRDLEKLAIEDISATDLENKVYIINRGAGPGTGTVDPGSVDVGSTPRGWKKIRILKSGDNYVIQHADIAATTFEEVTISKDATKSFVFFSFEDGSGISVEPEKEKWDIVFSVSSEIINFGFGDGAYGFSDFVLSNRQGGVEVARVELERDTEGVIVPGQTTYDDFSISDLGSVTFSADGNTMGSSWRSVFSRTAHNYVFFIVKDPEGNSYKVQFLGLLDDDGNRGHSSLKYELL